MYLENKDISKEYQKKQIICGSLMIIVSVALMSFNGARILPFLTISDAFLTTGAFLGFLRMLAKPSYTKIRIVPKWLFLSFFLIILSSFITTITSGEPSGNIEKSVNLIIAAVGVTVLVGITVNNEKMVNLIISVWTSLVAINAGVGLSDLLFGSGIGFWFTNEYWFGRTAGITMHPNHLGLACAMAMPIAFAQTRLSKTNGSLVIRVIILIALVFGTLTSGSRAAIVGGGISLAILILINKRLIKYIPIIFLFGFMMFLLSMSYNEDTSGKLGYGLQRLYGSVSTSESDTLRLKYYRDAFLSFSKKPIFGEGFGVVRKAHNIYLQVLQAGGIVGFVGFYWYVFGFLFIGWKLRLDQKFRIIHPIVIEALIISILTWLMIGIFSNQIFDRFLYIPMGLLLGIKAISKKRKKSYRYYHSPG